MAEKSPATFKKRLCGQFFFALPLPGWMARLMLGQMAREMLLASARVVPAKLLASGFEFQYERLDDALGGLLG